MIKSVIVIPSANPNKKGASAGTSDDKSRSHSSSSRQSRSHDRGVDRGSEGPKHLRRDVAGSGTDSSHGQKNEGKRKGDQSTSKVNTDRFTVMSIDHLTPLNWPINAVKYTECKPSISFSCEPSFCSHSINLSKEEEKHRKDLFVISDLLDDVVDHVSHSDFKSPKGGKRKSKKSKKKKVKDGAANRATADRSGKKKKKVAKERKRPASESQAVNVTPGSAEKILPATVSAPAAAKDGGNGKQALAPFASLANGDNTKIEKKVKRLKHLKKKILSSSNENSTVPAQLKKAKPAHTAVKSEESTQQKITIAFSQASGKLTTKSKWDTSSDEEVTSRKGAISYRFSDESDTQPAEPVKEAESVATVPPRVAKQMPFGKMQPGGILQTIEIHNPLPDMKPAVPLAHPNPGPDGAPAKSPSRSRSRSHSRSHSRSRSSSYSTDGSYDRRRRSRRHRRSYTRSYTRSRSRSYSSSRSRSYSRSYSRSTSRSHSRYRSYSRSSYSSYSSRSYSSRSRSRSPRYTRAVQPKYNNTRAYNLGRRKNFKKKKNQYKNQQSQQAHQNPNIQKQLETGRMKAEETVMRLKKQKEQQEDLQKRAMESIAKAASSAGIPIPNTATSSASPASTSHTSTAAVAVKDEPSVEMTASQAKNGPTSNLLDSYKEASQIAQAPAFVPRNFQNREFIGPIRPGMESDIPLPAGTPTSGSSKDGQQQDPLPMAAPNPDDEAYKDLEAQAIQHVQGASVSPTTEQLQLGVAQFQPQMQETATFIDPMTGQQVLAIHPQALQQQQMFLAQQAQLQQPAQSPQSADGDKQVGKDGKSTAPHEAVIESYAHQVFMSQQKALVSQSQSTFTIASTSAAVPQAGLPLQTTPMIITPAQLQMAQLQQAQAVQAAQVQAAAQAHQALQLQQLQQIQAASVGLNPQALALQPGLQQQLLAQQQVMQAQAAAAQGLAQHSVMQLPNGQLVVAPSAHAMLLQRFARPM